MDKRETLLTEAEPVFRKEGFRAVGVDRLLSPAGISTRTLYKHFGSKDGLALEVLRRRAERFAAEMAAIPQDASIAGLFDFLSGWIEREGGDGCIFLRALGEYATVDAEIAAFAKAQKEATRLFVRGRVACLLGREDDDVADQILILFEGATALVPAIGAEAVGAAGRAAACLLEAARAG